MHKIQLLHKKDKILDIDLEKEVRYLESKIFILDLDLEKDFIKIIEDILLSSFEYELYSSSLFDDSKYKKILMYKDRERDDEEALALEKLLCEINPDLNFSFKKIYVEKLYYLENKFNNDELIKISHVLENPDLYNYKFLDSARIHYFDKKEVERVSANIDFFDLNIDDEELLKLSDERLLSLDINELNAIKKYFLDKNILKERKKHNLNLITDCELEIFAQTWSEHCKHKEFNAIIHYENLDSNESFTINSLFNTYIKKSSEEIDKKLKNRSYLLKLFSDNAGVVKINDDKVFLWKVETHNSPSAINPYLGALTGILGNNRDCLGVGKGGAHIIFNTDSLCVAKPESKKLYEKQIPPKLMLKSLINGIKDGGNKLGIPNVNGNVIFDERFSAKPLVFCGSGAIMDSYYEIDGKRVKSYEKVINENDLIMMLGGRVGRDGIHGATFSSAELKKDTPSSVVQMSNPIIQKKLSDFLEIASKRGYINAITDNGAGGLSSSVGELATISNGARVYIEKIPLKHKGMKAWEIFISESQERMTLAVSVKNKENIMKLAKKMDVELTEIGVFTSSGNLEVLLNGKYITFLDLDFLHNGLPQKILYARYQKAKLTEKRIVVKDYEEIIKKLLALENIASKEFVVRQYDHEVQAKTSLKPYMNNSPQDAAVIRLDYDSFEGLIITNGIMPKFSDLDAYEMSAGAFDEAIRSAISVGAKLSNLDDKKDEMFNFWAVNDNFCVPDSVYSKNNKDGKLKLGKLVEMNRALYDVATFFNIPLVSGKDSMKNDYISSDIKISVPPTILYSLVHKIDDIRKIISTSFKEKGNLIYQVNKSYDELGGSEFYKLFNQLGKNVPKLRKNDALRVYKKMMKLHDMEILKSSHDISDGGLFVALFESAINSNFGFDVDLKEFKNLGSDFINIALFCESHSRFVVSIDEKNKEVFENIMKEDAIFLGKVNDKNILNINVENKKIISLNKDELKKYYYSLEKRY